MRKADRLAGARMGECKRWREHEGGKRGVEFDAF
jgi:hypothetical protein